MDINPSGVSVFLWYFRFQKTKIQARQGKKQQLWREKHAFVIFQWSGLVQVLCSSLWGRLPKLGDCLLSSPTVTFTTATPQFKCRFESNYWKTLRACDFPSGAYCLSTRIGPSTWISHVQNNQVLDQAFKLSHYGSVPIVAQLKKSGFWAVTWPKQKTYHECGENFGKFVSTQFFFFFLLPQVVLRWKCPENMDGCWYEFIHKSLKT